MKALSVRQPWAYYLFHGKPVENRTWSHLYRGPLLIHAGKEFDYEGAQWIWQTRESLLGSLAPSIMPSVSDFPRRCFVGSVMLQRMCRYHTSPWFFGPVGFVFEKQEEFDEPIPWLKGQLGFFDVPNEIANTAMNRTL